MGPLHLAYPASASAGGYLAGRGVAPMPRCHIDSPARGSGTLLAQSKDRATLPLGMVLAGPARIVPCGHVAWVLQGSKNRATLPRAHVARGLQCHEQEACQAMWHGTCSGVSKKRAKPRCQGPRVHGPECSGPACQGVDTIYEGLRSNGVLGVRGMCLAWFLRPTCKAHATCPVHILVVLARYLQVQTWHDLCFACACGRSD